MLKLSNKKQSYLLKALSHLHLVPTRKTKTILGRVEHSINTPYNAVSKVIQKKKVKMIVFENSKDLFLLDDYTSTKIIEDVWLDYVKNKYKNPGSKTQKSIVEHPVEIDISTLKNYTKKVGVLNGYNIWMPDDSNQPKNFLNKCKEVRENFSETITFDREEIHGN